MNGILALVAAIVSGMKSMARMNGEGIKPIHVFLYRGCLVLLAPAMFRYCHEVWKDTRGWLGLPVIPDFYFGTAEEFFIASVIGFTIVGSFAWFRIEDFCEYKWLDDDFVFERRHKKWLRYLQAMILFFILDILYMIIRWMPVAIETVFTWISSF